MLTGRISDPLSLLGDVCTATAVLVFCLGGFKNKDAGCEVIYMQNEWQRGPRCRSKHGG